MNQTSFAKTEMFVGRDVRILLCISNARNRGLIADKLTTDDRTVVVPESFDSLPQFDVCLVDTKAYSAVAAELERRRAEIAPIHLPTLLVLGPRESEAAVESLGTDIDEILTVPTSGAVLARRVDALVRTRLQSEQLALFRRAMDDATAGISIARAGGDHELQYVNDAFVEITGYDRASAIGRNCRFLQGPETEAEPVREIRAALDAEEPVAVDLRNYRPDGTMFWNHVEIAPVYGEHGVTHFVGFQQDITERVEQTRTLGRYERIVQAAGDAIYTLDGDLEFTLVNEATEQICGLSETELLGSHVSAVFGENHGDALEAAVTELTESAATETTIESTLTDGKRRMRQYQTTVALLPSLEYEGVVCVGHDITDDRQREARLSVLDRVLRHNLRNKLMVMLARVEFIQQNSEDGSIVESADAIEAAAGDLLDIAETARSFEQTVDPESNETVGPVEICSHTSHAIEESILEYGDIRFVSEVPGAQWAMAHESFELAMTELISHAAERQGSAEVVVRVVANDDETVTITVTHDGESLADVEREALTVGTETDLQHTTGLGLWYVRWMAINSGGEFAISDDSDETTVEITLPVADTPPGVSTRA